MAAMARSEDMKTPLARLSYPNLFKPQEMDDGKKKYNATLLIPKSDTAGLAALVAAVKEVVTKQWGEKGLARLQAGAIKTPILDGDGIQGINKKTGERNAGYEGHWFIRVSANEDRQPRLFTQKMLPATPDDIYAGCFVYTVVNAYAWSNPKNGDGVSFGLTYMQKAKGGDRLGGGAPPADKFFEKIADEGAAPAATKGGEGASGLFA